MSPVNGVFDRTGMVQRPSYRLLLNEVWSLISYRPAAPDPQALPSGGGHVVLIIPAFLTADTVTKSLRKFLERCGYRALGWGLGINWGPTDRLLTELHTLRDLLQSEGARVQREITEYAHMSQSAMQSTKIITESLAKWKSEGVSRARG